jgi:hypothetical protein
MFPLDYMLHKSRDMTFFFTLKTQGSGTVSGLQVFKKSVEPINELACGHNSKMAYHYKLIRAPQLFYILREIQQHSTSQYHMNYKIKRVQCQHQIIIDSVQYHPIFVKLSSQLCRKHK